MAFGLRDLAQVAITAVDQTSPAFDSLKRNIADLRGGIGSLQGMLAGLGVGVSAGGFALMIKGAIDAQAALDDLSDSTALTVETLSSLQQTARIGGHSFDTVTATAQKFAKSVAEAAGGNKELLRSFDALGISQERLRTGKFDDLYTEFATKIANAENKTYAIAYATDLAGKSAANALPFFKDLAESGLEQARVSTAQAEAADRLQKQIGRMGNAFDGIKNQIAADVVPAFSAWLEKLNETYRVTGSLVSALNAMGNIGQFGDNAVEQIENIDRALEKLKKNQGIFDGWLAKPLLGMRESGLLGLRDVAQAQVDRQAQRRTIGDQDDAQWGWKPMAAPPSTPGTPDTAGPQLIAQLAGQLAELNGESSEVDKVIRKLTDGTKQYTLEVQASALAIAGEIDEKKRQAAATKEAAEAVDRAIKVQQAADKVLSDFNRTQVDALNNLEFETKLLGMNETQRETAIALRKLENDFTQASIRLVGEENDAYARRMETMRQVRDAQRAALPGAVAANQAAKAAIEANKKMVEEAKRSYDQLTESLTDALLRGFESGKGFAENFKATLKNMFSTLILRPIIQPIAQGAAGAITGVLGMGMSGSAGAAGMSGAGGMGGLMQQGLGSILSGGGGIAGAAGMLTGGFDALFQNAGVGMGSQFVADIGNYGLGMPIVGGLMQMATGNVKGGAGSMIGGAIGSMFGPVGTVVGSTLGSIVGGMIGGKKGGPASFTGMTASGNVSRDALDVAMTAYSQNSNEQFSWAHQDNMVQPWLQYYVKEMFSQLEGVGKTLGLDTSRLDSASVPFNVSFQGTGSGQDKAQQILAQLGGVSDALANQLMPNLKDFAQANETATQTLLRLVQVQEQLRMAEQQAQDQLAGAVRGLPGALGITGLEGARNALSVSDYVSPMARLTSARGLLDSTYQSAMGGDLAAVNAFPQILQQALSIGRDVGASGPAFQALFLEGNKQLNDLLAKQQSVQADLLKNVPLAVIESSKDQIAELKKGFTAMTDGLKSIQDELKRMRQEAA